MGKGVIWWEANTLARRCAGETVCARVGDEAVLGFSRHSRTMACVSDPVQRVVFSVRRLSGSRKLLLRFSPLVGPPGTNQKRSVIVTLPSATAHSRLTPQQPSSRAALDTSEAKRGRR